MLPMRVRPLPWCPTSSDRLHPETHCSRGTKQKGPALANTGLERGTQTSEFGWPGHPPSGHDFSQYCASDASCYNPQLCHLKLSELIVRSSERSTAPRHAMGARQHCFRGHHVSCPADRRVHHIWSIRIRRHRLATCKNDGMVICRRFGNLRKRTFCSRCMEMRPCETEGNRAPRCTFGPG